MTQIMIDFLNLGLMASVMAMIVLGIRTCFRRTPKIYTYILWIFVFIRAVLPISYSSPFSLWTLFQNAPPQASSAELSLQTAETAHPASFETYARQNPPRNLSNIPSETLNALEKTAPDIPATAAVLWAAGFFAILLYSLAILLKLRKTIRFSVLNPACSKKYGFFVYESDQIKTAFILGFFRPSVYLPANLSETQKHLVLEHESTHIRRHDHQIKIAAWLILALHWFQPLLWVSFYFLDKDMELSCDEQVLRMLGTQIRTDYGSLLLKLAAQENFPAGIPISFCSSSAKTRIKHIMRYRPQKAFSAALTMLFIGITLYGCMGSPQEKPPAQDTEADRIQAVSDETPSDAFQASESEELAFAKKFIAALAEASTNIIADDIYEMLSPELKAEVNSHISGFMNLQRLETGHYITGRGPFIPGEPVITEKDDHVFQYQMTPVNSKPESYDWGNENSIWKGQIQVKRNAGGGLEAAEWENYYFEAITTRTKCLEAYQDSTLQIISESIPSLNDWKLEHLDDNAEKAYYDAYGDPSSYLENCLHLSGGKVTDVRTDASTQDKQVTYTWKDGSVVFYMQYREQDNIWVPFERFDGGYAKK